MLPDGLAQETVKAPMAASCPALNVSAAATSAAAGALASDQFGNGP